MDIHDKYTQRFNASSPDTRNMDVLERQAAGLRERATSSTHPDYVEFVATNMERIAADYAAVFQKMIAANKLLLDMRDQIADHFGIALDGAEDTRE